MSHQGSRYGSPSDYFSESESSKARSRMGRLTPGSPHHQGLSTGGLGGGGSRPASRHGSDLAGSGYGARSRSTDNLR